jgi:hypothetical protein
MHPLLVQPPLRICDNRQHKLRQCIGGCINDGCCISTMEVALRSYQLPTKKPSTSNLPHNAWRATRTAAAPQSIYFVVPIWICFERPHPSVHFEILIPIWCVRVCSGCMNHVGGAVRLMDKHWRPNALQRRQPASTMNSTRKLLPR